MSDHRVLVILPGECRFQIGVQHREFKGHARVTAVVVNQIGTGLGDAELHAVIDSPEAQRGASDLPETRESDRRELGSHLTDLDLAAAWAREGGWSEERFVAACRRAWFEVGSTQRTDTHS